MAFGPQTVRFAKWNCKDLLSSGNLLGFTNAARVPSKVSGAIAREAVEPSRISGAAEFICASWVGFWSDISEGQGERGAKKPGKP